MIVLARTAALAALFFASMYGYGATTADLERVARSVTPFLTRVQVGFSNCQGNNAEEGWGLVVGEDSSQVYVAAPRHLFSARTDPKCGPSQVTLLFWQSSQRKWNVNYQKSKLTLPEEFLEADIAFLKVPRPQGWRTAPPNMAPSSTAAKGTPITYLGYKGRPSIPFDAGRVLETCDSIGSTGLCSLVVEGISTAPGDSGAPLLISAGVFGIVLSEGQTLTGIRVDAIRKIASQLGVPWTLFTNAEEGALGTALNKAIQGHDSALASQMLDRRFNPDEKFWAGADRYPETPVSFATRSGLTTIVRRLISSGVINTEMAAAVAAANGNSTVITDLISNQRALGCALAVAMQNNRLDIATLIVSRASKALFGLDEPCMNMTPLHWATYRGYDAIANKLLDLGADPNKGHVDREFFKGYPLTNAILRQNWPLVNRLLGAGARADVVEYPNEPRDFGVITPMTIFGPLHAAAEVGNVQLLDRLVEGGADPDVHITISQGSAVEGGSPFEVALLSGNIAVARHLRERYRVSPLGYRYKDTLVREIRERGKLDASLRLDAEKYVVAEAKSYCQSLQKNNFKLPADFYNQEAKCRP
jgi:ankyrin repeat protein